MALIQFGNLKRREAEIPIASDKILIDLVNLIQVNNDLISFREKQGLFGQLLDGITGADRLRQLATDKNSTAAIKALHDQILELSSNLNISNNASVIIEEKLLETRQALRNQQQDIDLLTDLAVQFQTQLDNHEQRISNLEPRVYRAEVYQAIDRAFTAWESNRTYQGFHWAIQIAFITREIVDYTLADYERTTNNREFRQYVIDRLMKNSQQQIADGSSLIELFNLSYEATNPENREIAAYLLELESVSAARLTKTPYLFALGKTLELAQLPKPARPKNPARAAFELRREYPGMLLLSATSKRQFIEQIVNETANDRLYGRSYP